MRRRAHSYEPPVSTQSTFGELDSSKICSGGLHMGENVSFTVNGQKVDGWFARPGSGKGPAVVVIQEWWGLVPHIQDVTDRFAKEGFVALAPDLYHGKTTTSPDEAGRLLMVLDEAVRRRGLLHGRRPRAVRGHLEPGCGRGRELLWRLQESPAPVGEPLQPHPDVLRRDGRRRSRGRGETARGHAEGPWKRGRNDHLPRRAARLLQRHAPRHLP